MTSTTKLPIWFWVIAVAALLWNLMGVSVYLADAYNMFDLTAEQSAFKANRPVWYTACFALAVFTGALGSIALLIRKKWAVLMFLISLIDVLAIRVYEFFIQDDIQFTTATMVMPILVLIISGLLYWYSKGAREKAWLS